MKLSVIIPVYRVEHTLEQCVESILQQHFEDMEIILVDDGSPDGCPQICDRLQEKWAQVKVVHRKNGGLSAARNTGIAIAVGEYITFVDSDDWLEKDTLRPLMATLHENPDIDILEYPVDIKGKAELQLDEALFTSAEDYWARTRAYTHCYACNKVYRTALFSSVQFPEGRAFEDVWTQPLLLKKARTIATTANGCYHYRENPGGITAKASGKELTSLLKAHLNCPFSTPLIYLLNIQLDVYELTKQILLPDGLPTKGGENIKDKLKLFIYKYFGISALCKAKTTLKSHW